MGERRGVCKVLVMKSEGMCPLVRPKCRWEYNIIIIFINLLKPNDIYIYIYAVPQR